MQLLKIRAFVGLPTQKIETISEPPEGQPDQPGQQSQPGQWIQRSIEQTLPALQLQTGGTFTVTQAGMLADADALVAALQAQMASLEQQIIERSGALEQPPPDATTVEAAAPPFPGTSSRLYQKTQSLLAQLEAQKARLAQLEQQRDLAWETYRTLSSKVAELNLARAAANSEVRLAATAVPSAERADSLDLASLIVVTGIAGLLLALFVALLAHYLGKQPFLSQGRPRSVLSPAGD
jgi:uncharacterized protein involved in exopolysaccharide biosynthesis